MRVPCFVALIVMTSSLAEAAPDDWAEGGSDDGATRDFYNRGARLAWRRQLGDWQDRSGTLHGDAAFASARIDDTDEARFVEWDVTELVRAWVAGEIADRGFFLRGRGGGPIDFSSREGEQAPELVIDGVTYLAVADTFLPESTFRDRGEQDSIRVASSANALVRFDLQGVADVGAASLRLFTTAQFGGGMDVDVFPAVTGEEAAAPLMGIAAEFDSDDGIGAHPDVLLFDGFEAPDWMEQWTNVGGDIEVTDAAGFGFEPLSGRALRARIPEGDYTALNTSYYFMEETGEEPEAIYFRYYLRLGDDWDQSVQGGKLPGIAGTYNTAGWGGRQSDGTNGWSARGLFERSIPQDANNPLAGYTPIGSYVYHADMEERFGDNYVWNESWGPSGHGGVLETNRWYCIEHYVRLNDVGESNGVIRGWVNGRLSVERTDMRFRSVDALRIERIWMNIYHGGTIVSPYDQHAFIDHVVVARSYIGPMGGGAPADDAGPGPVADAGAGADAGSGSDAGARERDGGEMSPDGGAIDAGESASGNGSGCAASGASGGLASALMLMGVWFRRRRR
ncbi:MAG: polysaccharide lyase [Myxococcota bacterium]